MESGLSLRILITNSRSKSSYGEHPELLAVRYRWRRALSRFRRAGVKGALAQSEITTHEVNPRKLLKVEADVNFGLKIIHDQVWIRRRKCIRSGGTKNKMSSSTHGLHKWNEDRRSRGELFRWISGLALGDQVVENPKTRRRS
jgi:hypothetical protein